MYKTLLIILIAVFSSCQDTQLEFTHTVKSTAGLEEVEVSYFQNINPDQYILKEQLIEGDFIIQRVEEGMYTISLTDKNDTTSFANIPAKYINLDANIEFSRNVFQNYFPKEWEPMKGSQFSSIYIKSKADNQVFYMSAVYTGTDTEIGMYSEDF